MKKLFDYDFGQDKDLDYPFMDREIAYRVIRNRLYKFDYYVEYEKIINNAMDTEIEEINIAPIELADQLFEATTTKKMPMAIFLFVEKCFKDFYYQAHDTSYSYKIARLYYDEIYGNVDYKKAFKYFKKADKDNIGYAILKLGECYLLGRGTEKNYKKAYQCFAAYTILVPSPEATMYLGDMYRHGYYVDKDIALSNEFYIKAEKIAKEEFSTRHRHYLGDLFYRLGNAYYKMAESEPDMYLRAYDYYNSALLEYNKNKIHCVRGADDGIKCVVKARRKIIKKLKEFYKYKNANENDYKPFFNLDILGEEF
ncbi:sel1 repeat family protein [Peptostreptococcus anaerobius]|uniref:sel1 repeat family protein n=1 Tax=Peptostreptococcus anaerobius TaxID=1261 RepID=UPI001D086AA7|nr:sel1 repeat family protein [Peptostreptococcus anaerobius]MCB6982676.1 sel1 repeat family protein [Peptostreptococcus anaerobius]MCQ5150736.1 sel1 repeat family protein [Peptostreptococcus anaerobius]